MEEFWRNLGLGLFAMSVLQGGLEEKIQRDASDQMRESFPRIGKVRTVTHGRGLLGAYVNDLWSVDIYGEGLQSEKLPFVLHPRKGWKGSIRHLRLHFQDFTLRGLGVDRFEADIPFVKYDLGHAFYRGRLVIRAAEAGKGTVEIGPENLRRFILKKYASTLSDVEVWIQNKKLYLTGKVAIFGSRLPFVATGRLQPREERYVDLVDAQMRINRAPVPAARAASILQQINPVLDSVGDLGLQGFFTLSDVFVGDRFLTIHGRVTIPNERALTSVTDTVQRKSHGN